MTAAASATDPVVSAIVEAATRAPSSHNSQPWHFLVAPGLIHLYADRTRALPVNDPDDRELTISCGCALFYARAAAAGISMAATWELLPNPKDPDLLATLRITGGDDPAIGSLDNNIDLRRTYRKRFDPRQVADSILDELQVAAAAEGAALSILSLEEQRNTAADLIAEADAVLWHNPSWRRELAAWMHPRRQGDGLAVPWLTAPFTQAVVRTFDMGDGQAAKDRQIATESPVLAVLSSPGDGPADWLRTGQALGRVLLQACDHGVQASFLNQPVEVPAIRPRLQHLLAGAGFPQIVLRMGYPVEEVPPSPRRHLCDVIDVIL